MKILDHVMPREKDGELWTAVSGLLALINRAYATFLWHHEFIKATRKAALVVLKCESINVPKYVIQPADITRVGSLCYWPPVPQNGRKTLL